MLARRLSYHSCWRLLKQEKLVAVQLLRCGLVRLTFKDSDSAWLVFQ